MWEGEKGGWKGTVSCKQCSCLTALPHITTVYPSFLLNPFSDGFLFDLAFCAASVSGVIRRTMQLQLEQRPWAIGAVGSEGQRWASRGVQGLGL